MGTKGSKSCWKTRYEGTGGQRTAHYSVVSGQGIFLKIQRRVRGSDKVSCSRGVTLLTHKRFLTVQNTTMLTLFRGLLSFIEHSTLLMTYSSVFQTVYHVQEPQHATSKCVGHL